MLALAIKVRSDFFLIVLKIKHLEPSGSFIQIFGISFDSQKLTLLVVVDQQMLIVFDTI